MTIPWPYLIPLGVLVLVSLYFLARTGSQGVANAKTWLLRATLVTLFVAMTYSGALILIFKPERLLAGRPYAEFFAWVIVIFCPWAAAGTLLLSRKALRKNAAEMIKPAFESQGDFDVEGGVSPTERVNRMQRRRRKGTAADRETD